MVVRAALHKYMSYLNMGNGKNIPDVTGSFGLKVTPVALVGDWR